MLHLFTTDHKVLDKCWSAWAVLVWSKFDWLGCVKEGGWLVHTQPDADLQTLQNYFLPVVPYISYIMPRRSLKLATN